VRSWIGVGIMLGALACGPAVEEHADAGGAVSESPREGESEGEGEREGETEGESAASRHARTPPPTHACEHLQPCIEAFIEIAPSDLAEPARIALAQLPTSLVETSAREPACAAAITSYRHDLETHDLDVPDACR
jgi:hypothetical protein